MMFWKRKKKQSERSAPSGKIHVFSRHCLFSSISQHKKRLPHFSHELCYQNLLETIDRERTHLTFFLDVAKGPRESHFIREEVIETNQGSEAGSFLALLDHVMGLHLPPETILYFVEDDYLHRPGWVEILLEGFSVPEADYVTLYDHRDKYFAPDYRTLTSQLFVTKSCHWRTTPSTTQTFATRVQTLQRDLPLHRRYSTGRPISADHDKFCHLSRRGVKLISSMPGWATHMEPEFASPCFDWGTLLKPEGTYV